MSPSSSSAAMSLRIVAGETPRWWRSARALLPTGSLVAMKSSTMARSTSSLRSSTFIPPSERPPPTIRAGAGVQHDTLPGARGFVAMYVGGDSDLQGGKQRASVSRSRTVRPRLGHRAAALGPPRTAHHHQAGAGADKLLDEDSTFFGDLFPHAVQ